MQADADLSVQPEQLGSPEIPGQPRAMMPTVEEPDRLLQCTQAEDGFRRLGPC